MKSLARTQLAMDYQMSWSKIKKKNSVKYLMSIKVHFGDKVILTLCHSNQNSMMFCDMFFFGYQSLEKQGTMFTIKHIIRFDTMH